MATAGTKTGSGPAGEHGGAALRFMTWLAAHAGHLIVALGACMLVAYLASILIFPKPGGRILFGDATHHYVQLRSLVFDHDLDFRNEYVRLYNLRGGEVSTEWVTSELTVTGHVRNYMPIGPALLWAPLYLLVAAGQTVLAWAGLAAVPDGYDRILQVVPGVTGVVAATLAVLLSWRLARRCADRASAAVAALTVWFGSSAIYYSLVSPAYSHSASMLASAVFFSYWLGTWHRPSVRRFAVVGALAGVTALMRWQDAIFLCVPMLDAAFRVWPDTAGAGSGVQAGTNHERAGVRFGLQAGTWKTRAIWMLAAAGAWFVAFAPQMAVWQVLYGAPLAVPQGPSFLQWKTPHTLAVLLSDNHGLFTWTPLIALALAGLAAFLGRNRVFMLPLSFVLFGTWYINAAVADWWAGEAFGARRFLSLFPLFVVGLATWLQPQWPRLRASAVRMTTVIALVALNLLLLFQYQLFMKGLQAIAPYPRGWFDMWVARLVVPFRFLGWWLG